MLLTSVALAAPPMIGIGGESGIQPERARGPATSIGAVLEVRPSGVFAFEASVGTTPDVAALFGTNTVIRDFQQSNTVTPLTDVGSYGYGLAVFSPLHGTLVRPTDTHIALDLGLGAGAIQTFDDLEALQATGDPVAESTANQVHPALAWAAGPRVAIGPHWEIRTRLRGTHWVETYEGVNLVTLTRVNLAFSVLHRFGTQRSVPGAGGAPD